MTFLVAWQRRRAVKWMAGRLTRDLAISYGASKHYTLAQIRVAFGRVGVDRKYIDVAFAQYLEFEIYESLTGNNRNTYDLNREIFGRYIPERLNHPAHPAEVNVYVSQITGL